MQAIPGHHAGSRLQHSLCSSTTTQPVPSVAPLRSCLGSGRRHQHLSSTPPTTAASTNSRLLPFFSAARTPAAAAAGCQALPLSSSSCVSPQVCGPCPRGSMAQAAAGRRHHRQANSGSSSSGALRAAASLVHQSAPAVPTAPDDKIWIPFKVRRAAAVWLQDLHCPGLLAFSCTPPPKQLCLCCNPSCWSQSPLPPPCSLLPPPMLPNFHTFTA